MANLKSITIVGGGLAGLTLGIGLRQRGIPVLLLEAGHYPRHRVCGEFISGRGQKILEQMGLLPALTRAGARTARTVAFYSNGATTGALLLPHPAVCCSRYCLDAALAKEFQNAGGELQAGKRWSSPIAGDGLVRATGRRIQSAAHRWRWIGLKVHAAHVSLEADLEMHFLENGYIGFCRLDSGEVNVCGLFRSRLPTVDLRRPWPTQFRGRTGSALFERFACAAFDESSFCAVAGLSYISQPARDSAECSVGDALAMIAPMTGNGMSMAFESAALAVEPLQQYSFGQIRWDQAQRVIAQCSTRVFRHRLRVARWLHTLAFRETLRSLMIGLVRRHPCLLQPLFLGTR